MSGKKIHLETFHILAWGSAVQESWVEEFLLSRWYCGAVGCFRGASRKQNTNPPSLGSSLGSRNSFRQLHLIPLCPQPFISPDICQHWLLGSHVVTRSQHLLIWNACPLFPSPGCLYTNPPFTISFLLQFHPGLLLSPKKPCKCLKTANV